MLENPYDAIINDELNSNKNHFITVHLAYGIIIPCKKYHKFSMGIFNILIQLNLRNTTYNHKLVYNL